MGLYNNHFKMQDFFSNRKLTGIFPQFYQGGTRQTVLKDDEIFRRCQVILNNALMGTIKGDTIEVDSLSYKTALSVVTAYKPLLESFFNNIDKVIGGLRENKKVYTSISTISQVKNYLDYKRKIKLLNEILDNLKYSPDFGNKPSKEQETWKRKVSYKD